MHPPDTPPLTRRALLGAMGVGVLAAVAGCNPFSTAGRTITVTASPTQQTEPTLPPQTPTVLLGLVFTTRLHVQDLTTAIATDKRDAALFAKLLVDRKAHLTVLEAEYARRFRAPAPIDTAAPTAATGTGGTSATTPPPDPDEILGRIRGDAATAQGQFTDALAGADRFEAQLFGSIAACVATHRMVLA